MITLRCVARPTPTAPRRVEKPWWQLTAPMTTPKMPAFRSPTKRSFVAAIDIALDMYCRNATFSWVCATSPPPTTPSTQA